MTEITLGERVMGYWVVLVLFIIILKHLELDIELLGLGYWVISMVIIMPMVFGITWLMEQIKK